MNFHARYAPLTSFLQRASGREKAMDFAEIEALVGRSLPPSATGDHARQWWANTQTHPQGKAWLDAGWRVRTVEPDKRRVHFVRSEGRSSGFQAGQAPQTVEPLFALTGLPPAARRMVEDYMEEAGVGLGEAMGSLLQAMALERRRKMLESFVGRSRPGSDSVALVREDRDAR